MAIAKTTVETAQLALPIRIAVGAASVLDGLGFSLVDLKIDHLKAAAEKQTGLRGWNHPEFLRDMAALCAFVEQNPTASSLLKLNFRNDVMRRLTNYLKLQEKIRQQPDILQQPIKNPIIITGLPRTGTTLLQRLLAQDPALHGPALWELFNPIESVDPQYVQERQRKTEGFVNLVRNTSLNLWSIHPTYANEADECYFLMPQSLGEVFIYAEMDYFDWFMQRSAVFDYQLYRQYLQVMHYGRPPRRWVLKTPLHLPKLNDLLTVFPDAYVIQCHRTLNQVIASWVSFTAISRKVTHKSIDLHKIARDWLHIWQVSVQQAQIARDQRPATQFYDVYYDDFVLDPLKTVRAIYQYFNIPLAREAENRMQGWLDHDKQQERLGHRYTLDQCGLTENDLDLAFADYMKRYKVYTV
ncbi:MAG: sulfotransferase [bacterium]|nr:sulfotransferase [bacterium]